MIKIATVLLFFFLALNTLNAQCGNPVKGDFQVFLGQKNLIKGDLGSIIIGKFTDMEGCNFPLFVEWREGNYNGKVLKSGIIKGNLTLPPMGSDAGILENLTAGQYYLIVYDSSPVCKKNIFRTVIK